MSKRYRRNNNSERGLVSIVSYLIRQFYFPNPFSNMFENQGIATIVNWICGCVFILFAKTLTGSWYNGGERTIGSIGFFINYSILTGLFMLITKFIINLYLTVFLFIVGYVILYIVESRLFG